MNYHLYHHDDLDGIAAGAIMLEFLKARGDDYDTMHPVNYGPDMTAEHWMGMHFKKPFMVFDFQYHPDADWWVDHHGSGFRLAPEHEATYQNDQQHRWDPDAPSGAGLVKKLLEEEHGFVFSDTVQKLGAYLDIEDAAAYPTLEAKFDLEPPYKQIILMLESPAMDRHDHAYFDLRQYLVRNLAMKSPEEIISEPKHQALIDATKTYIQDVRQHVSQKAVIKDKCVVVDATDINDIIDRSTAFLFHPKVPYTVVAFGKPGAYKVRAVRNDWMTPKPTLHMTETARAINDAAGGHNGIGGFTVTTQEAARDALDQLTKYINQHG